jgi:hypothetical protein
MAEGDCLVELILVSIDFIEYYKIFEQNYNERLKHYMSRIYPYHYEQYAELTQQKLLFWNYIVFNDNYIGSVWLEKKHRMI